MRADLTTVLALQATTSGSEAGSYGLLLVRRRKTEEPLAKLRQQRDLEAGIALYYFLNHADIHLGSRPANLQIPTGNDSSIQKAPSAATSVSCAGKFVPFPY